MSFLRSLLATLLGDLRYRRLRRWQVARTTGYTKWETILDPARWEQARRDAKGPRVLVATSVGAFLPGASLEGLLAAALTLRGAQVHVLLCDAALPACLDSALSWHKDPARVDRDGLTSLLCATCFAPADRMYRSLGLPVHRYGETLTPDERRAAEDIAAETPAADIPAFKLDGIAAGEHALAGALRFFARGTIEGEPCGEFVLRAYFRAALLTTYAMRRLLPQTKFDAAVFHHGIYVPQGITGECARAAGVRVVNWNPAYRKKCFVFSHGDTYHHTLMDEPADRWESLEMTREMDSKLSEYLKSRWQGTQDWIWFHEKPKEDIAEIARELGIDFSKPCVGCLTNVFWDAQLHYPANAFPNMLVWLLRTIEHFAKRPDLQLVIRVHPAEIRGTVPSRQKMADEVRRAFPVLPRNVFLVPPESRISTYALMQQCRPVIIYGTKTGVELTSVGIPVICAGEAWIRNKGLTLDARSADEYFALLDRLPMKDPMPEDQVRRARRYAYHFFFRRMVPVDFLEQVGDGRIFGVPPGAFDAMMPGRTPGLDVICKGILEGSDFIYPAERLLHGRHPV